MNEWSLYGTVERCTEKKKRGQIWINKWTNEVYTVQLF